MENMKPSNYDGKPVVYVDHFKLTHTGTVVGQSDDGKWLLVRSDNPKAPPLEWHFKVTPGLFDLIQPK